MTDIDPVAVETARRNAERNSVSDLKSVVSDGLKSIDDAGYTLILSNPPYHTDFSVAKHFIEKGFNRLAIGGRMVMVVKRKGWYAKKLTAIFGGVKATEQDGYVVLTAEKRQPQYANAK